MAHISHITLVLLFSISIILSNRAIMHRARPERTHVQPRRCCSSSCRHRSVCLWGRPRVLVSPLTMLAHQARQGSSSIACRHQVQRRRDDDDEAERPKKRSKPRGRRTMRFNNKQASICQENSLAPTSKPWTQAKRAAEEESIEIGRPGRVGSHSLIEVVCCGGCWKEERAATKGFDGGPTTSWLR